MKRKKLYDIGNHLFLMRGDELIRAVERSGGFAPFESQAEEEDAEFTIEEWDGGPESLPRMEKSLYRYRFDNVTSDFGRIAGGYMHEQTFGPEKRLAIWSRDGETTLLIGGSLDPWLTGYAIGMGYELMTVAKETVLVHSSCMVHSGKAILFLGKSGTGKSTHSRLWQRYIGGSHLLNDDCPAVRMEGGRLWAYGNPWSGKTPCHLQERYPVAGFVRLSQAPRNRIRKLERPLEIYSALHPSFFSPFATDDRLYDCISGLLGKIVGMVPVYSMECLPDREAAEMTFNTFFG